MKFLKKSMNIVDLLAIAPFYISILLGKKLIKYKIWPPSFHHSLIEGLEEFEVVGKTGKIIRLIRKVEYHYHMKYLLWALQDHENIEDFQTGETLCRASVAANHTAAGHRYIECHWQSIDFQFEAYKELGLLLVLIVVAILVYSSLVYFAERDSSGGLGTLEFNREGSIQLINGLVW